MFPPARPFDHGTNALGIPALRTIGDNINVVFPEKASGKSTKGAPNTKRPSTNSAPATSWCRNGTAAPAA
jgi:hypothetical protein